MNSKELNEILEKHVKWLNNENGGEQANLRGANLNGANLRGANLRWANLYDANLRGANLYDANLRWANLRGANLRGADLNGANLNGANLNGANLRGANLRWANLYDANLNGANLNGANLNGANLRGANLRWANLYDANLRGANLRGAKNVPFIQMACPYTGSFIGWKKAACGGPDCVWVIVKLEILEDAKRSSATTRKCRCSKAKVLAIETIEGTSLNYLTAHSNYDPEFIYEVGEIVSVDNFDEDRWNECAPGIHFFINRQEAVEY